MTEALSTAQELVQALHPKAIAVQTEAGFIVRASARGAVLTPKPQANEASAWASARRHLKPVVRAVIYGNGRRMKFPAKGITACCNALSMPTLYRPILKRFREAGEEVTKAWVEGQREKFAKEFAKELRTQCTRCRVQDERAGLVMPQA